MSANRLFKQWFKTPLFRTVVCTLIAWYIRLVYYTSWRRMEVHPDTALYVHGERQAIFAFWHGRLMMMAMLKPYKRHMNIMISKHRDGELIACTMHKFGFGTVRGSSSRGGAVAAKQVIKALQAGDNISITPDGPRGPAMKLQPGIITIAEIFRRSCSARHLYVKQS